MNSHKNEMIQSSMQWGFYGGPFMIHGKDIHTRDLRGPILPDIERRINMELFPALEGATLPRDGGNFLLLIAESSYCATLKYPGKTPQKHRGLRMDYHLMIPGLLIGWLR